MENCQAGILAPAPRLGRYQLKRMVGAEDGITDALFKFTLPVSGSYFWCPPIRGGKLDLRALGL